ncbi:MAG: hypothetical protein ACJ79S_09270, partial [Gemmatimonadaceae bacterium]
MSRPAGFVAGRARPREPGFRVEAPVADRLAAPRRATATAGFFPGVVAGALPVLLPWRAGRAGTDAAGDAADARLAGALAAGFARAFMGAF